MIYQILFVFALLIVALNNVSATRTRPFTKEELDVMYEEHEKSQKTIEWSYWAACTKDIPFGFYQLYKKVGEEWKFVQGYAVKRSGPIKVKDFDVDATYVVYGIAHNGIDFDPKTNHPTNFEELKDQVTWMRSEEKCFKNSMWLKKKELTKEDVEAMNEKHKKKKIEWTSNAPCTKDIPVGWYHLYKKDGEVWKFVQGYAVKRGEEILVSDSNGYNADATYVVYGMAHKDMKFIETKKDGETQRDLSDGDKLSEDDLKFIRSEETCFKNGGIIGPIISIAVLLALCACCVFGCRYFKKNKRGNSSIV